VAVGALLAGAGFGIGLASSGSDPAPVRTNQAGPAPVPQAEGAGRATPSAAGDTLPIMITDIQDLGTAVELTWIDPTDGEASFVISELGDAGARPVLAVAAGQTQAIVGGLDPTAARYCFRVLAVLSGQAFASSTTCTPPRPGG
jgi:hypothetical protein